MTEDQANQVFELKEKLIDINKKISVTSRASKTLFYNQFWRGTSFKDLLLTETEKEVLINLWKQQIESIKQQIAEI